MVGVVPLSLTEELTDNLIEQLYGGGPDKMDICYINILILCHKQITYRGQCRGCFS